MGKLRHKRLKISRYSPTNLQSKLKKKFNSNSTFKDDIPPCVKEIQDSDESMHISENYDSYKNKIQGGLRVVVEKINSDSAEEKLTGLNMLAAFALELKSAEDIVQSGMVTSIVPLLCYENSQVRLASAGALRNLCSWGSDDLIETIVQHDVLQPLSQLIKSYEFNNPDQKSVSSRGNAKGIAHSMSESDPQNLIFNHAVNVLWSLCECNEEAISHFNREGLVNILLRHIDPFVWGYETALSSADCLFCVSENNSKAISSILPVAEELYSLLAKSLSKEGNAMNLHYAIVVTGVLLNVNFWVPSDSNCSKKVLDVLGRVLNFDACEILNEASSLSRSKLSLQEHFDHAISSQLIAFEVLSNFCCPDVSSFKDDCDDDLDQCENFDSDEFDVALDGSMDVAEEIPTSTLSCLLSIEMIEGLKYHQLVEKTLQKVMFGIPACIDGKTEEEMKDITDKLLQLRTRGLQCLQNLINCLQVDDLGGVDSLYSTWVEFCRIFYHNSSSEDSENLAAISGVMRATVEKLSDVSCSQLSNVSLNDLQMVFEAGSSCTSSLVRANLCRMVGFIGCFYVKQNALSLQNTSDGSSSILLEITKFLLKIGQNDSALWVRAEALDVLIDLFSDDLTDDLALTLHLDDRLKEILPQFKAKCNQEKKKLGDHKPLVLTVRDNLPAFIKYKERRLAKDKKLNSK